MKHPLIALIAMCFAIMQTSCIDEQYDLSNWLAKEANLEYLNDILGLTLTDADKEVYVGPYRCDLVAKDETSGITVIIENQLQRKK
jgi:hypothetical protein